MPPAHFKTFPLMSITGWSDARK